MNRKFAEHVTQVAFNLTLSRAMIVRLTQVALGDREYRLFRHLGLTGVEVPVGHRLRERGLIVAPDHNEPGEYKLTEAGRLVFALLQEAGLIAPLEKALVDAYPANRRKAQEGE